MTRYVVLADYQDSQRFLRAGEVIDDTQVPLAELVRGGLAAIVASDKVLATVAAYNLQARGNPGADLAANLLSAGQVGGGGGIGEFVFADFGTQDEAQGRYTSWTDLMAKLATLQVGAAPTVRLALTTGPFTVPSAGMPPSGWDFRGGWLTSFYGATGAVVLDVPDGVMFDNLFGIGGQFLGSGAVVLQIHPSAGTQVLNFSGLPLGAAFIHVIGGGSAVDHSTDPGAYMKGPDANTTMVLVSAYSQQGTGLTPPLSGPLLELGATDGAVGAQFGFGGLPDGWLVGGGPTSPLLNIHDASANPLTSNVPVWVPGFTGGGGVTVFSFTGAQFVNYDDVAVSPPLGATNVQAALDALKVQVSGSAIFEDFISLTGVGSTGMTVGSNGAGSGVFAVNPSDPSHPGVVRLATGTAVGGRGVLYRGVTRHTLPAVPGGRLLYDALVQLPILASGAEDYFVNAGFSDNVGGGNPTNGIVWRYDFPTPEWVAVLRIGGVDVVVATGPAVVASQWTRLVIDYEDGIGLSFRIGSPSPGPLVQVGPTIAPAVCAPLLASPGFAPSLKIQKQVGVTNRDLFCDYILSNYNVPER